MSILNLLRARGIEPRQKPYREEYSSPCPACGEGNDRFIIFADNRFWCRKCGIHGDEIDFLRQFEGKSFQEALLISGKDIRYWHPHSSLAPTTREWSPAPANAPSPEWSARASYIVELAMRALWRRPATLDYLRQRGLNDDTILLTQMGWIDHSIYDDRRLWGMPIEAGRDKLCLPTGLLIPGWHKGTIIRLRIRLETPINGNRYWLIGGSSLRPELFGQGHGAIVVTENDLDAMAVAQQAGDLAMSLGMLSCAFRPDKETHSLLLKSRILLALDDDVAGNKAATEFWHRQYPNSIRHLPLRSKDIGEMATHGVPIRIWVQAGLDLMSK